MKEEFVCSFCGKELTEDTAHEFSGRVMCSHCFELRTSICNHCGKVMWKDRAYGDNDILICETCFENYYSTCEDCGRLLHNDDAYYFDESDYPYCRQCYDKINSYAIKSYNYKPELIFYGSGDLFIGVELEIDKGGESNENAKVLLDIANQSWEHIYCKHDGSINDGFEIVSHPMSLDYHINRMNWEEVFNEAVSMYYRSHQTSTCGLHLHVNRSAFGDSEEEQEDVISRIVFFVENHWNELMKFSRRSEATMNRWASRYGISTTAKDTYKNAKDRCMGRYVAVNIENIDTVEFRLFKGTLCYKTFVATLQLVYEICRFAIQMTDKGMESLSWSEFVSKLPDEKTELIEYLKAKRLYVNELTEEGEDM